MQIKIARREGICYHCENTIKIGDVCILTSFRSKEGGFYRRWLYHATCYLKHLAQRIAEFEVAHPKRITEKEERPRAGTVMTIDREKRRRLMALYRYHRKCGNSARMETIAQEITRLSYGIPPYGYTVDKAIAESAGIDRGSFAKYVSGDS